jgi:hypothetical protein
MEIETRRLLRRVLFWDGHTARQFRLQPPPVPAPQDPGGAPQGIDVVALECALTANVESCCSSCLLLQEGHSGSREPITMASKRLPQSSHLYSKIGIVSLRPW